MIWLLKRILATVEDVIWPERVYCLLCDERADDGWLCESCSQRLSSIRLRGQTGSIRSAYNYARDAEWMVKELKFNNLRPAAKVLADGMAEEAQEMQLPPDTIVTWVDMPRRRMLERGVDHGRLLAQEVAERLGLQALPLLRRIKRSKAQKRLTAKMRRSNLLGVFECTRENIGAPVLLVDDVLTTGSTVGVCKEVLIGAGAKAVYAVTATRVRPSKKRIEIDIHG